MHIHTHSYIHTNSSIYCTHGHTHSKYEYTHTQAYRNRHIQTHIHTLVYIQKSTHMRLREYKLWIDTHTQTSASSLLWRFTEHQAGRRRWDLMGYSLLDVPLLWWLIMSTKHISANKQQHPNRPKMYASGPTHRSGKPQPRPGDAMFNGTHTVQWFGMYGMCAYFLQTPLASLSLSHCLFICMLLSVNLWLIFCLVITAVFFSKWKQCIIVIIIIWY